MQLEHFYSDFNGRQLSKSQYHETPSAQTVQQAVTLGRVQVGEAEVIHNKGCIVVIVAPSNGLTRNVYRDMYRIKN